MKLWTSDYTFNSPWQRTCLAAWNKYPNPFNPAVEGIDVIDRRITDDGILHSRRLLQTQWGLPRWVTSLVGFDRAVLIDEESEVDPHRQTLTLRSRNLTFGSIIRCDETLVYSSHPDDASRTLLKQDTAITVRGLPFRTYLEDAMATSIAQNAHKGRRAMEWVIENFSLRRIDEWMSQASMLAQQVTDMGIKGIRDVEAHVDAMQDELKAATTKVPDLVDISIGEPEIS